MIDPHVSVLLVDDELAIVRALTPALRHAGFTVEVAGSGEEALRLLASNRYDVILLDLGLPDMDGQEVISRLRQWSDTPIIVLSARDMEEEKVRALDGGADDYVSKPFAIGELMARIRAAGRGRARRLAINTVVQVGDLEVDLANRRVKVQGEEVRLTVRENDLVQTLAAHAGRVLTHKQLITAVWGASSNADAQFVRVLIGQVRQKLEVDAARPRLIRTEPGIGYRLAADG